MDSNLSEPTKAVCYREVSTVKGVCYKRFHCTHVQVACVRMYTQVACVCMYVQVACVCMYIQGSMCMYVCTFR